MANVGKHYRIQHRTARYSTLRDSVVDWCQSLAKQYLAGSKVEKAHSEEFWALRELSFSIGAGEVVGIIGRNGAGKSTLLKILSRITAPSTGRIRIRGRIASLLEVGTGFHPELTGRENVFLNGAILGMRRQETAARFDAIVAFAGVEKFLDTPVKHYSSGMYTRLAFAVAAHLEPEILIIDEVLAVGDMQFQQKCLDRMGEVSKSGRTVLFVSHNMQAVRALCQRCLLLLDGKLVSDGSPGDVVAQYYQLNKNVAVTSSTATHDTRLRRGSGAVRFTAAEVLDSNGHMRNEFEMGETIRFRAEYTTLEAVPNMHFALLLNASKYAVHLTGVRFAISRTPIPAGRSGQIMFELPTPNIRPGEYPMMFWLGDEHTAAYDALDNLLNPLMISTKKTFYELGFDPTGDSGFFNVDYTILENGFGPESSTSRAKDLPKT